MNYENNIKQGFINRAVQYGFSKVAADDMFAGLLESLKGAGNSAMDFAKANPHAVGAGGGALAGAGLGALTGGKDHKLRNALLGAGLGGGAGLAAGDYFNPGTGGSHIKQMAGITQPYSPNFNAELDNQEKMSTNPDQGKILNRLAKFLGPAAKPVGDAAEMFGPGAKDAYRGLVEHLNRTQGLEQYNSSIGAQDQGQSILNQILSRAGVGGQGR